MKTRGVLIQICRFSCIAIGERISFTEANLLRLPTKMHGLDPNDRNLLGLQEAYRIYGIRNFLLNISLATSKRVMWARRVTVCDEVCGCRYIIKRSTSPIIVTTPPFPQWRTSSIRPCALGFTDTHRPSHPYSNQNRWN